ncbi:hypothetical protein TRVA0_021S00276 [Trichomonascus vanleenenianus]|uniref:uncharacterized protein n=1 Tax=Trichomonascus vanleenenianus TaxID=2268995 RepID=UPI003ECA1392
MRLHSLFCLAFFAFLVSAFSVGRVAPLSYVSPVERVSIDTKDHHLPGDAGTKISITATIPSSRRYHNLDRRWYAVADPNNAGLLGRFRRPRGLGGLPKYHDLSEVSLPSEQLFGYLTRNSTLLEAPTSSQEFKFVLERNTINEDVPVYTTNEHGETVLHPEFTFPGQQPKNFIGQAFRRVLETRVADGSTRVGWRPVGWARVTVHQDGPSPRLNAVWKVADEAGLGVPAAIYHLESTEELSKNLRDDERHLLASVKSSQFAVWRDLDMRKDQINNFEYFDADYSFLTKRLQRRQSPGEKDAEDTDFGGLELLDEYYKTKAIDEELTMVKRAGSDDDTGNSGFSSGVKLQDTIGNTNGCPKQREIALVGIAADCNYLKQFNSSSEAREHIITIVNTASQSYETAFNVSLGLKSIYMVNSTSCPTTPNSSDVNWNYACEGSSNVMSDRLSYFSQWRGASERSSDGLATWSLMTSCSQGSVVGLSWLGMLCGATSTRTSNTTYVSGVNVISKTSLDWRVIAHEIGHSFGAVHDCTEDTCAQGMNKDSQCCPFSTNSCNAGGKYIMNPSTADSQDGFSECSVGNVCSAMGRSSVNSTCLTSNTGVTLLTKNECGNGIVEEGEECDCGGEIGCKGNTCCDPKTCKYTKGSVCDDSNEACCQGCKFASSETVCRASQGPCDPAEYCPGTAAQCPSNKLEPNGKTCKDPNNPGYDDLVCISGHCTSRYLQCITLLANTTLMVDDKELNITGACNDDTSCQLSCVDKNLADYCFTAPQNFLDGTPCQGKGQCQRGVCVNGSKTNPFSDNGNGFFSPNWLNRHKNVVIGVVVGIGGFLLILVLFGFIRKMTMRSRVLAAHKASRPPPPPPPPGPPPVASRGPFQPFDSRSTYAMYPPPPPVPPPAYYANYEMDDLRRHN